MKKKGLLLLGILFLGSSTLIGCNNSDNHPYLSNSDDFLKAIQKGENNIYVDDISFANETAITLNYSVNIIGRNKKSRIENANFLLEGTLTTYQTTPFTFTNIIFDGGVDETKYDFITEGQTFYQMFNNSNRDDKKCLKVVSGYTSLSLSNCEITRYAARNGPTIYIDNDANYCVSERYLNIDNCHFHHNICYEGILQSFHEKGVNNIINSTFSDNIVKNTAGPVLSNGKGNIDNIKVINNRFYHFVNNNQDGDPIATDDLIHIGDKAYNYVSFSGSIYIGGGDMRVTNSYISGNKNLFGGGIGFATPQASLEGQRILFKDNVIINNEAKYGGAIYAKSRSGNTVKFINCAMQNNKADYGSVLYATTMVPYLSSFVGGVIGFEFSSMVNNVSKNNSPSFVYNELLSDANKGEIDLRACFVIDDSTYTGDKVNYVANKDTAISDKVITNDILAKADQEIITPIKGSKADLSISEAEYKTWDTIYSKQSGNKAIGYHEIKPKSYTALILAIVLPITIIVILVVILIIYLQHRKRKAIEERNIEDKLSTYTYEQLFEIVSKNLTTYNLTKKEIEVATYLLILNKRKEIASKLFVSEDTAKTHISHIFKKMKISSKQDLRKIINRYL